MPVQESAPEQKARNTRHPARKSRKRAKKMRVIRLRAPRTARVSSSYLALVMAYPIHPIRSDEDLDEAIRIIDKLLGRKKPLDPQEQDYLDSLSHEVEHYEAEAHPMPAVSGAAMLRHLIEARDVKLSEVAEGTGIALSTLSSVLSGKRQINRNHIAKLADSFRG